MFKVHNRNTRTYLTPGSSVSIVNFCPNNPRLDSNLVVITMTRISPLSGKYRSSRPEAFLRKGVLKICSKFTGEHRYRSVISIKLLCNFIEITFRHRCSAANSLHIFRTPCPENISRCQLL